MTGLLSLAFEKRRFLSIPVSGCEGLIDFGDEAIARPCNGFSDFFKLTFECLPVVVIQNASERTLAEFATAQGEATLGLCSCAVKLDCRMTNSEGAEEVKTCSDRSTH